MDGKAEEFGEACLLDEDLCEILKSEDYEEDTEETGQARFEVADGLLKEQYDDFCSWGFEWEEVNTLLGCKPEEKKKEEKR